MASGQVFHTLYSNTCDQQRTMKQLPFPCEVNKVTRFGLLYMLNVKK